MFQAFLALQPVWKLMVIPVEARLLSQESPVAPGTLGTALKRTARKRQGEKVG